MDDPFFSVVIPTYNRASRILATLDSVFNQSFQNFEIIIVDNLSTDNTVEVLSYLINEQKIRFYQNDKNYERSRSRNRGMGEACGKYVILLDSDDRLYPTCLEDAYTYVQSNGNIRIFHNLYGLTDEKGCKYQGTYLPYSDNLKNIAYGNFLACNGVFIHKDLYQNLRFDENTSAIGSEDWDFWLRAIAYEGDIGRIDKVNSSIVIHSGRSMENMDIERLKITKEYILDKVARDADLMNVYKPYYSLMRASANLYLGSMANFSKKHSKAVEFAIGALKQHLPVLFSIRFWKVLIKGLIRSS